MSSFRNWGSWATRLVLCLLCVMILAQPVSAVARTAPKELDIYTTRVRYQASRNAAVIGQMENGAAVTVLEDAGDFYKVDCYDMTGYIAKEQVILKQDGKYYIACSWKSDETVKLAGKSWQDTFTIRSAILTLAKEQLGDPYVYGGMNPGGFDCSGLTYYIYGEQGYALDRCADEQMQDGLIVSKEGLQVGDLVFFRENGCSWLASHVGIYAGDGMMIHAGSKGICYSDLTTDYYSEFYLCARRVVTAKTAEVYNIPTVKTEKTAVRTFSTGFRTAD